MVEMKYRVGCNKESSFLREEEESNEGDLLWSDSYCDDEWRLIWSSEDEDMLQNDTGVVGLDLLM